MKKKNIHQGHRERLRSRFMNYGADVLCEHEILELILFYALPRINTNELAHELLERFHSINGILSASTEELTALNGIGPAAADLLHLLADICCEYSFLQSEPPPISSQSAISDYLCEYFNGAVTGLCLLVMLDDKLKVAEKISFSLESVVEERLEIRRVAEIMLRSRCSKIVLGINHPERLPVPDQIDYIAAHLFAAKFKPMDICLIDCMVCSGDRAFSMKENGAFSF